MPGDRIELSTLGFSVGPGEGNGTERGGKEPKAFIDGLTDEQAAAVVATTKDVAQNGLAVARHLRGEVYEVRTEADRQAFRILFAQETTFILLCLSGFQKKSAKIPPAQIVLAESRLDHN